MTLLCIPMHRNACLLWDKCVLYCIQKDFCLTCVPWERQVLMKYSPSCDDRRSTQRLQDSCSLKRTTTRGYRKGVETHCLLYSTLTIIQQVSIMKPVFGLVFALYSIVNPSATYCEADARVTWSYVEVRLVS